MMALLKRLYSKLHLKINESKGAVGKAFGRKFLGFTLWRAPTGEVKRAVCAKARETLRQKIRQLTSRTCGRNMSQIIGQLRRYVTGWKAYFNLAQTPKVWHMLDEWMRHRMRAIQLKQWRRGMTMYRELLKLGAPAKKWRGWWRRTAVAGGVTVLKRSTVC